MAKHIIIRGSTPTRIPTTPSPSRPKTLPTPNEVIRNAALDDEIPCSLAYWTTKTKGINSATDIKNPAKYSRQNSDRRTARFTAEMLTESGARGVGGLKETNATRAKTRTLPMPIASNAERQPAVRISHSATGTRMSVPSPMPTVLTPRARVLCFSNQAPVAAFKGTR